MNSYERKRRICKVIVLVLGILSINNIILTIRNYSYAYFEKNVKTGVKLKITTLDEMPSKYATDDLKKKVVSYADASKSDFGGGLVAVNTNGTLYNETAGNETIREYRYSGLNVNNYIYYNCKDKDEDGQDVEQNADNCEIWRIVGIFKDENGNEHLKIVNNKVLTRDIFPSTFNTTYNIQGIRGDNAYWNKKTSGTNYNDWATAGLQYWLNGGEKVETKLASDGYMSYLSKNAKDLIEKTKYYLGTVTCQYTIVSDYEIIDTPKEAYANERTVSGCADGKGPSTNSNGSAVEGNSSCRVWRNNSAIWEGYISLLYPSDYGYSADSEYWDTILGNETFNGTTSNSSWLQKGANHNDTEWLLSSSSESADNVASWYSFGGLSSYNVYNYYGVRPSLNLKSEAIIFDGDGTSDTPYKLKLGN